MSSAQEGGATANATSLPYGGGGAGGKFRKKPLRRQTTPYDRPPTALHGSNTTNNSNSSSWLTKLVVEPASKLISYGADRFFASVLRRRLPAPPSPQPPEVIADVSHVDQGAGGLNLNAQDDVPEPRANDCSQPTNSSSSTVVVELEQLLKQKTFTRSEIVHLTELLQSRAVEASLEDVSQKKEENASDFCMQQQFASGLSEGNINGSIRSTAIVSTPAHNSKVLEDDIASPAELAKAYMGSRPSKVSPSVLGMRSQLGKEDSGLFTSMAFASKSPIMSSTKNTSVSLGAPENGFVTPRSRSRSAIYNMARTPYSRVHPTSILKGSGINSNGYAGPSTSTLSRSVEYNEDLLSQPLTLKRRSSALDDEGGSVGPMRRIRQKSNLLAPRFQHTAHRVGIGSQSKQKPELIGELRNKALKNIGENENESVPSTSYAHVPSKSSEVAARILQNLEKLSPKEKPSESKLVAAWQKSPLKSTPSILSRQAPRSMEDVGSSKLLLDVQDNHKFGDKTSTLLPDARDSSLQKQGKAETNDPKASVGPSSTWNSVLYNDSALSLKASTPSIGTSDFVVRNGSSQPPQKKRAFRMSAEEDSLEQDDVLCNGLVSRSMFEKKGSEELPLSNSSRAPAGEFKIGQTAIESEDKSPLDIFRRTSEHSPGSIKVGERTSLNAVPASEETMAAKQSEDFTSSVALSDKTTEANNSTPLFNFSYKVVDKFPSLPAKPLERAEPEPGSSSRRDDISVSIGSEVKAPESENGFHLKLPKPGDINGRCDDVSSASSNGSLFPSFSPSSFPAASSRDTNQISTGSVPLFSSSASISSTPATSSGSIFGLDTKPSSLAAPTFNFGSSVVSSNAVSAAPTPGISQVAVQRTTSELNPSSGGSNSSPSTVAAFAASSSGSSNFGLGSSVNFSTGNNLQDSLFASASKSQVSGVENVSQASSNLLFSSSSIPAANLTASPLGSTASPTFGFTSTSSSGPSSLVPVSGSTSSLFKFGASSTTVSEGSAPSFSTSPSPAGIFSFGLSSSSASTATVGSSSGTAPSMFNFGGTCSSPASVVNTGSSFSSGTSGIFNFGGSSSASTPTFNSVSSSSAPSATFGSSWPSSNSAAFSSSSTGLTFAAPSTSNPIFPFAAASASASPIFSGGFAASPGNNDQMNAEDTMAEDPAPSSTPVPVFGQPAVSQSPSGFVFGSTVPSPTSPFMFSGQQNQVASQNPSPFQAAGSLEFSAGGSFSLGSTGVSDKSGRKIVKINRSKNRKK